MLTPKIETVADQQRYGGKDKAHKHFEEGMGRVFHRFTGKSSRLSCNLYYAFKQQEVAGRRVKARRMKSPLVGGNLLGGLVDQGFK
jgi:adenine-specific DNA methylase